MILSKNFKVENNGIWILKEELQSWKDHYESVVEDSYTMSRKMFYKGKSDFLTDLLKAIEREKGD